MLSSAGSNIPAGRPTHLALYDGYGRLQADINAGFGNTYTSARRYSFTAGYSIGFGGQFGYYTEQSAKLATGTGTDSDRGLILCTYRYYDPINVRWLTRDPIGYDVTSICTRTATGVRVLGAETVQ